MKKVNYNTPTGRGYCGPVVVAALTGKSLKTVEDVFRDLRHPRWRTRAVKPAVKGTNLNEVIRAMRKLGWFVLSKDYFYGGEPRLLYGVSPTSDGVNWAPAVLKRKRPTVARWCRERDAETRKHPCIIGLDGHWVAVHGNYFVDTHTGGKPVGLSKAPFRRAGVRHLLVFEKCVNP